MRKTKTPRLLSIVRKLWTYLGNTTLASVYAAGLINDHQAVIAGIVFNGVAFTIQLFCDTYFVKEKNEG
jgi:hypothetical protein